MEPITMVLAALAAGAGIGITEVTKTAIADTYQGLRTLVKDAFKGDEVASSALTLFEDDPNEEAFALRLTDALVKHRVMDDASIVERAQKVIDAMGPAAVGPNSVAAGVLKLRADRGGVAVVNNAGTIIAGYSTRGGTKEQPGTPS